MKRLRSGYAFAALLIAAATLVLWLLHNTLTLANFSLIYLLAVLVIAIRRGIGPSLFAAVLSFICFNFFLIQPLYTFLVYDPRELLDLIIFFAVAVLTGQLAALARAEAENARQRASEQMILFKLTSAFNQLTTTEGVYEALVKTLRDDMGAVQAQILPDANSATTQVETVFYLLLRTNSSVYGTLCVSFDHTLTPVQIRLLETCANQAALALHRIDLIERARKSRAFEEADKLKTALLHAVSHDLRTPITIIKTSAHNLRTLHDTLPESEQVEILESVESEADELDQLVGNLLDMSRLRAGALQLNIQLNDLEEVIGDVAARAFQRLGQQRIKISFPADMPLVPFDYGLIQQALTNLVQNTLRYEPPGSLAEIVGRVSENEARVGVINHGESISPQEREQIMEPFYTGKDGHIGLGLPIVKGIIEAHHGQLWVDDTAGGGATFWFSLPLKLPDKAETTT
jgi:two-component system, OmpR family, sensor histidine kinase KdpD